MKTSKASEALRVAQQIAAIRAALKKQGYHLRKRPKQAAWNVLTPPRNRYLLTYQPAPISTWVLHPQNDEPNCKTLETIIQRAIAKTAS